MANNPLYPGYSPGKENEDDINPLYPGYYTGKPLSNKPQPKNFLKPIEFDADIITAEIDNIGEKVLKAPLAGPRWIKERIVDDWKSQLKVSVSSSQKLDVTELDDYSVEDFPGVSLELSLNPNDWGLNPKEDKEKRKEQFKKQLKKTINSWTKETTGIDTNNLLKPDFADFKNRQEEKMWTRAMGYGEEPESLPLDDRLAVQAVEKHVTAAHEDYWDVKAPLDLKGEDPDGVKVKIERRNDKTKEIETQYHKDIYRETATNVAEFQNQKGNPKNRDKYYNGIMREGSEAVSKELEHYYKNSNDTAKKIFDKNAGALAFYDAQNRIVQDIYDLDKSVNKGFIKEIKKIQASGGTDRSEINTVLNNLSEVYKSKEKSRAQKFNEVEVLYKQGRINKDSYSRFVKDNEIYKTYLNDRMGVVKGVVNDSSDIKSAIKKLSDDGYGKKLTTTETFNESIAGRFQKGMENSILGNKDGDIGRLIRSNELKSAGVDLKAKALIPIIDRNRQDRIYNSTLEVLDAWDGEKLLERYVWKRIKQALPERLEAWTSGSVLGKQLEKTNYFGLKVAVDDDGNAKSLEGMTDLKKISKFKEKYGYKVNMKLDKNVFGIDNLELKGGNPEFDLLKKSSALQFFELSDKGQRETFAKLLNGNKSDQLKDEINQIVSKGKFGVSHKDLELSQAMGIKDIVDGKINLNKLSQKKLGTRFDNLDEAQKKLISDLAKDGRLELDLVDACRENGLYNQAKNFKQWAGTSLGSKIGPSSPVFIRGIPTVDEYKVDLLGSDLLKGLGLEDVLIKRSELDALKIFSNGDLTLIDFTNRNQVQQIKKMLMGKGVKLDDMSKVFFNTSKFQALSELDQKKLLGMIDEFGEFTQWLEKLPDGVKNKLFDSNARLEFFKMLKNSDFKEKFKDVNLKDFSEFQKWLANLPEDKRKELLQGMDPLVLFGILKSGQFGDKYKDPTGENSMVFSLFQKVFDKNNLLGRGYKLGDRKFIGSLEKLHKRMEELQSRISGSFIGRAVRFINNWKDIIAKKAAEMAIKIFSKVIANLLGAAAATTGFLAPLMPFIKAVAEKVIKKIFVYGEASLKALFKLDTTELEKLVAKDVKKVFSCCLVIGILLTLPMMIISAMLFMIIGAVIGPADMSEVSVTNFGEMASNYTFNLGTCTLTDEVLAGAPEWYYSQCNPDWSSIQIDNSPYSIGNAGCTLTTIAMVYNYYGYSCVTPEVVNNSGPFGVSGNIPSHHTKDWDSWINGSCIPAGGSGIISGIIGGQGTVASSYNYYLDWFQQHPDGLISLGMTAPPDNQHWVILRWDGTNIIIVDPYPTSKSPAVSVYPGAFGEWTAVGNTTGYYCGDPSKCTAAP